MSDGQDARRERPATGHGQPRASRAAGPSDLEGRLGAAGRARGERHLHGLREELLHLLGRAAGEVVGVHRGRDVDPGEERVGGEPLREVVGMAVANPRGGRVAVGAERLVERLPVAPCLLYTSDAADE